MKDLGVRVLEGISRISGRNKLGTLLLDFSRLSNTSYAFVGRLNGPESDSLNTLILTKGEKIIGNICYPLVGSPCGKAIKDGPRIYRKYVQRFFPNDFHTHLWDVHGFIGMPIVDPGGETVGLFAAFYQNVIDSPEAILGNMESFKPEIENEFLRINRGKTREDPIKRFEALIRNSREINLIVSRSGKVLYRAPSNYQILGISPEESIGLNIFQLIHPEDVALVRRKLSEVTKDPGSVESLQVRARQASGGYRWIEGTITNQLDDPSVKGLIINYHDITDQKQANEELQRNERRFRALLERSHDCISLLSADNKRLYYSPAITSMLGYTPEELLGTDAHSMTHPDDLEEMQRMGEVVRTAPDKSVTYQARLLAKDGSWKWIRAVAKNKLHDPDIEAIVVNFEDISEQKIVEDRLKLSEKTFRDFLESVKLAGLILNAAGDIEFINDFFLKIIGYKKNEVLGKSFFDLLLDPEDSFKDIYLSGIQGGGIPQNFETTIRTDRDSKLITWNGTMMRDLTGRVNGITCIGEDVTEFRKNEAKVKLQIQRVSALHAIDVVISSSFDARIVFSVLVDQIMNQMGVDAVRVLTYDPADQMLNFVADRGFHYSEQMMGSINIGDSHSGQAVLERRTIRVPDVDARHQELPSIFEKEKFKVGYSTPMTVKGQVKGVVEVYSQVDIHPDPSWLEFFETMAGQAAIAIENNEMFDRLERALADLTSAYDSTLEGWVKALDLRDKETIGHTQRVAMMVVRFALELGVSGDTLVNIRRGALLHDIGKMGIPDYILNKAGPLTLEERQIIERHPQYAYELLQPIAYLRPSLDIPYAHHERWDGKGYPRGLKGEEIPLAARIFAIVDVWDALGSTRTYREKWERQKILDYLIEESGKKFDPKIVSVFIDMLKKNMF